MHLSWLWRLLLAAVALSACLSTAHRALADANTTAEDREARKLFESGAAAFEAEQYERALESFEKAYDLSPRPVLLFNIAKSEDKLDRRREALEHYKRFLAAVPDAANRAQVERRIDELDTEIAREPPPPVPTAEEAARASQPEVTPVTAQPLQNTRDDRIHKKWWFWTGIGAVVAAGVAVGVVMATRSGSETSEPLLLDDMTRVREL
jgi:tetratricopeptide (TPR) repeat protein